jgi:hypothetical protein
MGTVTHVTDLRGQYEGQAVTSFTVPESKVKVIPVKL